MKPATHPQRRVKARKMSQSISLGQRFNRLVVVGPATPTASGNARHLCKCDCGKLTTVIASALRSGSTKSCGCLSSELSRQRKLRHGMTGSWQFLLWCGIVARCDNRNEPSYPNYGGREITYDPRWVKFEAFLGDIALLGPRPEGFTIDRKDNSKNYTLDNIRWASATTQARNRRSNRILTHNGKTQCLAAWTDELGLGRTTIADRLRAGWTVEKALST